MQKSISEQIQEIKSNLNANKHDFFYCCKHCSKKAHSNIRQNRSSRPKHKYLKTKESQTIPQKTQCESDQKMNSVSFQYYFEQDICNNKTNQITTTNFYNSDDDFDSFAYSFNFKKFWTYFQTQDRIYRFSEQFEKYKQNFAEKEKQNHKEKQNCINDDFSSFDLSFIDSEEMNSTNFQHRKDLIEQYLSDPDIDENESISKPFQDVETQTYSMKKNQKSKSSSMQSSNNSLNSFSHQFNEKEFEFLFNNSSKSTTEIHNSSSSLNKPKKKESSTKHSNDNDSKSSLNCNPIEFSKNQNQQQIHTISDSNKLRENSNSSFHSKSNASNQEEESFSIKNSHKSSQLDSNDSRNFKSNKSSKNHSNRRNQIDTVNDNNEFNKNENGSVKMNSNENSSKSSISNDHRSIKDKLKSDEILSNALCSCNNDLYQCIQSSKINKNEKNTKLNHSDNNESDIVNSVLSETSKKDNSIDKIQSKQTTVQQNDIKTNLQLNSQTIVRKTEKGKMKDSFQTEDSSEIVISSSGDAKLEKMMNVQFPSYFSDIIGVDPALGSFKNDVPKDTPVNKDFFRKKIQVPDLVEYMQHSPSIPIDTKLLNEYDNTQDHRNIYEKVYFDSSGSPPVDPFE